MNNVIKFPGADKTVIQDVEKQEVTMRFVIGDQDFFVESASRPVRYQQEWSVFNLEGRTYVPGESYWAPMYVTGNSELGDTIQGFFPLEKMSLELLDTDNVLVEWWEFKDVFLSTESDRDELVIYYREAITREFVGN